VVGPYARGLAEIERQRRREHVQACEQQRTALVSVIQTALQKAESGQEPVSDHRARDLVGQADRLIADTKTLAGASTPPSSTVCG